MNRFSLRMLFAPGLIAFSALAILNCQATQGSKCDPCAVAVVVKIINLDQLSSGTRVVGKSLGNSETHPIEFESSSRLFKISGSSGRYLVSIIANGDSLELPDTLNVDAIESKGCLGNNTVNLDVEVKASATGLDSVEVRARTNVPRC